MALSPAHSPALSILLLRAHSSVGTAIYTGPWYAVSYSQYERRYRELYRTLAIKSEEMKKHYNSFNKLEEKKGYVLKEVHYASICPCGRGGELVAMVKRASLRCELYVDS